SLLSMLMHRPPPNSTHFPYTTLFRSIVQKRDYIRIDIPGPGLPSAKGYDWVQVEDITQTADTEGASILLTLRPSPDPTQDSKDRSEEHTSELQSRENLVCRLLLEKKN